MPENGEFGIVPSYRPEKYIWLKKRLPIDLPSLDDEVMEMQVLIQEAAELTATAVELREAFRDDLEKIVAEESEQLRVTPTPKGKARSETAIASEVPLSPKVSECKEKLSTARLDAALWGGLAESLRGKAFQIRVVADLVNSGFLTPTSITAKRRQEIRDVKQ